MPVMPITVLDPTPAPQPVASTQPATVPKTTAALAPLPAVAEPSVTPVPQTPAPKAVPSVPKAAALPPPPAPLQPLAPRNATVDDAPSNATLSEPPSVLPAAEAPTSEEVSAAVMPPKPSAVSVSSIAANDTEAAAAPVITPLGGEVLGGEVLGGMAPEGLPAAVPAPAPPARRLVALLAKTRGRLLSVVTSGARDDLLCWYLFD